MEYRLMKSDHASVGRGATPQAGTPPRRRVRHPAGGYAKRGQAGPSGATTLAGNAPTSPGFVSLLGLRRALGDVVVPTPPRPEFRDQLHSQLVRAAQQQHVQRALSIAPTATDAPATNAPGVPARLGHWLISDEQGGRRWVFGAAAVGSAVSLAGALALILRYRVRRAA